jgi:hypothetical protein
MREGHPKAFVASKNIGGDVSMLLKKQAAGPGTVGIGVTGSETSHSYSEHREHRGKAHLTVLRLRAQSAS